jgi:hypothetical protein
MPIEWLASVYVHEPSMNSSSNAVAREYRTLLSAEGYVHKFRLEASEAVSADDVPEEAGIPTVGLAPLLGKFALVVLVFAGIAGVAARLLS